MKDVIRQWAVSHVVAVVIFSMQSIQNFASPFAYSDDVRGVLRLCRFDDFAHHIDAIGSKYIGYVLAVAGQDGEQTTGSEIVGKMFDECTSGQVPVSAYHDVSYLI